MDVKRLEDYLYYEEENPSLKIYCGDCLEILPLLPNVDLVVTDPPYGIGYGYLTYNDTRENLDFLISGFIPKVRERASICAVFSGVNNLQKYPVADWTIAWHWRGTNTYGKYGINQWQPIICYGKDLKGFGSINGILKSDAIYYEGGNCDEVKKFENHPCPKNVGIMKRIIVRLSNDWQSILDPFLGSGTTLVACKELNRNGIGIEISEKYCDIAKKRLQNTTRSLF
jgi:DNA modification methylase